MDALENKEVITRSKAWVENLVLSLASEYLYFEEKTLELSLRFEEDLCVDKRSFHEYLDALEEELAENSISLKIDGKDRKEIETLNDVVELVSNYAVI